MSDQMSSWISNDRQAPVNHLDKIFIDGRWTDPSSSRLFEVLNCATEDVYARVVAADADDVDAAVAAARRAFDHGPWPRMSPGERAEYIRAIADGIRSKSGQLAHVWSCEMGVLHKISQPACTFLGSIFDEFAAMANSFPFTESRRSAFAPHALVVQEPVGVVAAILPWNGPGHLIGYKCGAALLAGCTLVLKAAPEAPGAAYLFAEACEQAGLPPGVVNVLAAHRETSERLVRHSHIDKVSFTGSTGAGKRIAAICAERMARYTLELGGKSPAVILDDYDLEEAAAAIKETATVMTGQVCFARTRIIIPRRRHDALVEAIAAAFDKVKVGNPFDPQADMGPVASQAQRERIEGYIGKGKAEGARLAAGGDRPAELKRGFFLRPTLFADVSNDHTIAREEIFGPVVCVIPVDDEAAAISVANDTKYGLAASVFTNDAERAYALSHELRAGTVTQNGISVDFSVGFGGFKESGIGREGGSQGLTAFLESKTVLLRGQPALPPAA